MRLGLGMGPALGVGLGPGFGFGRPRLHKLEQGDSPGGQSILGLPYSANQAFMSLIGGAGMEGGACPCFSQ